MEELLIIKIGGQVIDDETALQSFLTDFASIRKRKVLVHGGGKLATELSARLGIETRMVEGRRITDMDTLRIITMTYAGWINKSITAQLQARGCNAIGLCGVDGKLIPAIKRPVAKIDYGWVGDIEQDEVNDQLLIGLTEEGYTPVIAPVTADRTGQLLNVNADTVAMSLAQALSPFYNVSLIYCFEKKGLLMDVKNENSVVEEISIAEAANLKGSNIISGGMIPKTDNAFKALQGGVQNVIMGKAEFIKQMITREKGYGTYFKA